LILNERAGGRKTASGWEGWAYLLGSGKKRLGSYLFSACGRVPILNTES